VTGRVLVTGASGFIGTALVPALLRTGYAVRATTRGRAAALIPKGAERVSIPDMGEPIDWRPALESVDCVVHMAGIAHVGGRLGADVYDRVNHAATAELVAACARAGVRRFVFLSSLRAQSGAAVAGIQTERDEPRPTEPYGISKLKAEVAVRSSGAPWTILRPAIVYGPSVKGNLASLLRIAATPWPPPFARFANRRSLLALENLVAAIALALTQDACVSETFLVADPKALTLAEIVAALRKGAGRSPRLFPVPPAIFETGLKAIGRTDIWERLGGDLVVDPSKLIGAGWRPDPDTAAGLARMAAAHRARV
jgi:nucleoside-diphosphate-sugar epimerase